MQIIFVRHGQSTQNIAIETGEAYDSKNIILTERGKEQAKITGKYLYDTFGKFDKVYCSTLTRCKQTAEHICKEIKYINKITYEESLRETYEGGKIQGMSKDEVKKFVENNDELNKITENMENEKDPYKKVNWNKAGHDMWKNYNGGYSRDEAFKNLKKFQKKIKKQNYNKVLVVTHGGIIEMISKIVSKIDIYNDDLIICSKEQSTFVNEKTIEMIELGNCSIMGLLLENNKYQLVIPWNNLHLKDMNKQILPENKNIYFVRHSERLDKVNPDKWVKCERYKDKMDDTPITENGYKIAKETILELLNNDKRQVENIYSSPTERCIQTALEFQKQIYKKDNRLIKIKVEYGLVFFSSSDARNFKYTDNKIIIQNTIIDEYMSLKRISDRYGKDKFDLEYESIYTIKQINQESNNMENQINQRIDTVYGLYKKIETDKINICCTHGEIIAETITRYALKIQKFNDLIPYLQNYFNPDDYCFWLNLTIEDGKIKLLKHKYKEGIFDIKDNKF